ncbi:hypothetical protein CR513_40997, partial [Mucuna pruriens]
MPLLKSSKLCLPLCFLEYKLNAFNVMNVKLQNINVVLFLFTLFILMFGGHRLFQMPQGLSVTNVFQNFVSIIKNQFGVAIIVVNSSRSGRYSGRAVAACDRTGIAAQFDVVAATAGNRGGAAAIVILNSISTSPLSSVSPLPSLSSFSSLSYLLRRPSPATYSGNLLRRLSPATHRRFSSPATHCRFSSPAMHCLTQRRFSSPTTFFFSGDAPLFFFSGNSLSPTTTSFENGLWFPIKQRSTEKNHRYCCCCWWQWYTSTPVQSVGSSNAMFKPTGQNIDIAHWSKH